MRYKTFKSIYEFQKKFALFPGLYSNASSIFQVNLWLLFRETKRQVIGIFLNQL